MLDENRRNLSREATPLLFRGPLFRTRLTLPSFRFLGFLCPRLFNCLAARRDELADRGDPGITVADPGVLQKCFQPLLGVGDLFFGRVDGVVADRRVYASQFATDRGQLFFLRRGQRRSSGDEPDDQEHLHSKRGNRRQSSLHSLFPVQWAQHFESTRSDYRRPRTAFPVEMPFSGSKPVDGQALRGYS